MSVWVVKQHGLVRSWYFRLVGDWPAGEWVEKQRDASRFAALAFAHDNSELLERELDASRAITVG